MKLLFAYFDFSESNYSDYPRSLGECALNFSTTHNYAIQRAAVSRDAGQICTYTLSCHEKPEKECIPDGFWGDRIFNVTAIVGINGSGKSTIIHNMIKAVVYGLKPGVPFLIVLQKTDSEDLCLYCSEHEFYWEGPGTLQREYPEELKRTKTMLLDNTLSFNTINLDRQYESAISPDRNTEQEIMPTPIYETRKQFYNKSLVASIRFSNSMSLSGRAMQYFPVLGVLASHFRYETYQEIRLLFDRFQQENLNSLDDEGFTIPKPKSLLVSVSPFEELFENAAEYNREFYKKGIEIIPIICKKLERCGLIGEILADAVLNLCADTIGAHAIEVFDSVFILSDLSLQFDEAYELPENALKLANEIIGRFDYYTQSEKQKYKGIRGHVKNIRRLISFLSENTDDLLELFEPVESRPSEKGVYRIDVGKTVSEDKKRNCIISFLELYRPVSEPDYFLVFSSGMSSGEKNFLRMMTQFRYILDGSPVYSINATEKNTGTCLKNIFPDQREYICDTLFLFLDEADLTYHPEWQRIFISKLTSILPRMFCDPYNGDSDDKSGCKDIQVVITTHSPIMLGDFPNACVNYLKGGRQSEKEIDQIKQQSTFGENLYTILKNSFFMKAALGEFASNKINEAVHWCSVIRGSADKSKSDGMDDVENVHTNFREMPREVCWNHYRTANLLPPGIIRSKLIAEMRECAEKCSFKCSGECAIKSDKNLSSGMNSELMEMKKQNDELKRKLDQANEKLKKAGLLNEQNS